MAGERVEIDVVARDLASAVMRELRGELVRVEQAASSSTREASRGFDRVAEAARKSNDDVKRSTDNMESGFGRISGAIKGLAVAAATGFIGDKIKDFGVSAIQQASDLNEAGTKLQAVFGDATSTVNTFAAGGAKALGQNSLAVQNSAAQFGVFGKAAGMAGDANAEFSTKLVGLSTDLASFYNTTPADAAEAISAGLRGETEPLRQYGVLLDDATLRQKALSMGLISTTKDALTPQQKVLASNAVIWEQTTLAQGDFVKTSAGLANQQRILSAQWTDLKGKLGAAFLPMIVSVVTALNDRFMPMLDRAADKIIEFWSGITMDSATRSEFAGQLEGAVKLGAQVAAAWDLLRTGTVEASSASGLGEADSPLVKALLFAHRTFDRIGGTLREAWMVLIRGDFEGGNGYEEDSPVIDFLFTVREKIQDTAAFIRTVVTGDFDPSNWGSETAEDSPIVDKAFWIRDKLKEIATFVRILVTGDFDPSAWGASGIAEDSPLVDKAFTVREKIGGIVEWLKGAWASLSGVITAAWATMTGGDKQALWDALGSAGETTRTFLEGIRSAAEALPSFSDLLNILGGVLGFVADNIDTLIEVMPFLIAAWVAYRVSRVAAVALEIASVPLRIAEIAATFTLAASNRALAAALGYTHVSRLRLIISTIASTASTVAHAVATAATTVAMWAVRAATIAWTAAQWLLTAAMDANPIMIVVLAIAALVAGIIWAYNNVDWFRELVDKVWSWIGGFVSSVWENQLKPALTQFWEGIQKVGDFFSWLWTDVIVPVWQNAIAPAIQWVWENVIKPYFEAWWAAIQLIGSVFSWLWDSVIVPIWQNLIGPAIQGAWNNVIKPVWDGFWGAIDAVGSVISWLWNEVITPIWTNQIAPAIQTVWDNVIKPAWDALKGFIADVGAFFQGIWDGIVTAAGNIKTKIEEITKSIKDFLGLSFDQGVTSNADGSVTVSGDSNPLTLPFNFNPPGGATGGMVRGAGTGTSDSILARVSDGEFIVNARSTAEHRGTLEAINSYAVGGFVDAGRAKAASIGDITGAKLGKYGDDYKSAHAPAASAGSGGVGAPYTGALSGGVEQWRSMMELALQLTGQSLAYVGIGLHQMDTESSGNRNAINLTDSNARKGTPSIGLMQVIQPTFDSYAMPPYNTNIYDPLSNIIASIRYVLATYRSLPAGWRGVAYDGGGLWPSGTAGVNDSGGTEMVLSPELTSKVMAGVGGRSVTIAPGAVVINVNGRMDPGARAELRAELEQTLRDILSEDADRRY